MQEAILKEKRNQWEGEEMCGVRASNDPMPIS